MAVVINRLKSDLRKFLFTSTFITLIGLIFIYSASSVFAMERFGDSTYFLKKQFIYLCLALIGFFIFALVPKEFWKRYASLFFVGSIFVTLLTFVPMIGLHRHGSDRWLSILGFSFQPSEFLKLFLLIYLGYFLEKKQSITGSFLNSYLPYLIILGVTSVVLLKQPDFGSMVTIFATSMIMLFVAEFNTIYLLVTLFLVIPVGTFLIITKSYRLNRILIFLNPWADPKGRGFQIIQSLIAIGSGSVWGLGISNSKQKFFYLPMQHTDFIFPIIAEETGFIGSCIIITLYLILCYYGMRLALQLREPFEFFTCIGFITFISLQAAINLMVTTGLVPTKGLGLPFISYGGTAIISLFCMLGLITNFVRNNSR